MPKPLSDTQRILLSHAATRDNRRVLPLPASINKNNGAIALSVRPLLANGLLAEIAADPGDIHWGEGGTGEPTTLVVTEPGMAAIGITSAEAVEFSSAAPASVKLAAPASPRKNTKLAIVIARLSEPTGATIEDLVAATGWQKHSVRGAISGILKTKRRLTVTSTTTDGRGRVYRIESASSLSENAAVSAKGGDA